MKTFTIKTDPLTGEEYFEVHLRGRQILGDPFLNKGTSFTEEERLSLGLSGLIRSRVSDIATQRDRNYANYSRKRDDIEKYVFLQSLLNRNETLFYDLLCNHLTEMLPIVYTPTVGQACMMLSHITRDFRGLYITPENIGNIDRIFAEVPLPDVRLIVVTDGERILGLGDLGADGMGIPVGKINLYVAAGGLHPACCLPVMLDVGTNSERLLNDPLYTGFHSKRLTGADYEDFIEHFVLGVRRNFPNALLQWEDFAKEKAFKLLERYAERILSFDDDIQGTGAAAVAALMTAMRIKRQRFRDQRFLIIGMGQAGTGMATNIQAMLVEEGASEEEARSNIFACDLPGLLMEDTPGLAPFQRSFAQRRSAVGGWKVASPDRITHLDVVHNAKPTVVIGVTATPGLFDRELLSSIARNDERPVVFALSNPTSKCECTPLDVAQATNGKGLAAMGSPFEPFEFNGRMIITSQVNNMYVFPGVGLGALVSNATKITPQMFHAASRTLSSIVTDEQCAKNMLLPDLDDIRKVSAEVAKAVAIEARDSGLGRLLSDENYDRMIRKAQWWPRYYPYRPATNGK